MDLLSTNSVCGESRIRLNGRELNLTWDGIIATGKTELKAPLSKAKRTTDLSMTLRALCIASPQDSVEDFAAQILAVTFYPTGQVGEEKETSGFALSFNSVGTPRVFRLLASPVTISEEHESYDYWLDPSASDQFHVQNNGVQDSVGTLNLEEELQQLHALKQEAQRLQDLIKEKDQMVRMHLLHDCICLNSRLKKCKTFRCFAETSFKFVPDIFRLMKYRFGTLPPTLAGTPCQSLIRGWQNQTSTTVPNPPHQSSNSTRVDVETKPGNSIPQLPNVPGVIRPSNPRPIQHVIGDMVVMSLILTVMVFLVKRFGNSISCRRRRVDIAARREERRTRHAYRAAACRYRFRLWWTEFWNRLNGISNPQPPIHRTRFNLPEADDNIFTGSGQPDQPGENTMRNEILGFRRALEYVGQLVHINGPQNPSNGEGQRASVDIAEIAVIRGSATTPTVVSSVAPLTTIGSPRTSTILSYDETDELSTIESIYLETATMISG